ncbi:MAG TPA: LuxR C-terminal-related transcriptional regulator [Microlunatus sp.]|jgi:LuxR family maltose regulon positive regulatory protein|nr:LuxR C-terminal-related transcriptional regulator [Microlunatus sp.]
MSDALNHHLSNGSAVSRPAVEWALLDVNGVILAVNDAWRAFSAENGGDSTRTGVGVSYLEVCENADDAVATEVADSIRSAISGALPAPEVVRFPCDAPDRPRILDLLVSSRFDDEGRCVGATVTLSVVEDRRRILDTTAETKLHAPSTRTDWLDRPRLMSQMARQAQRPIMLISAPAGYGKTTLVTQWVDSGEAGPVAWLHLDPAHNDPTRLWADLVVALERIGCSVDGNVAEYVAMNSTSIATHLVPRVIEALVVFGRPLTVVLADCHVVRSTECNDQLGMLIEGLPDHARVVMVSRWDPAMRLGRLRVEGRLAEIRTSDLSFSLEEARLLLSAQDVALSETALQELHRLTEGWPAAVCLAALYLKGRESPDDFVERLSGSNRYIADYLSEEVLSRQDPEVREFILSMSVFDRFDAALADYVTGTRSSARLLRHLERTNLLLLPLHGHGWFRFHHLFGAFAQSALEIEHPERVTELHRRGAEWFAARNDVEQAIHHTIAAGDLDRAAALVQKNWLSFFEAGRSTTVSAWLRAFRGTAADDGAAATVTGAWIAALTGDLPELRRREVALESMTGSDPLPDGTTSAQSALMLIRGLFGYAGPDRMLADAQRAILLEPDTSTLWHAVACAALGHASFVTGDVPVARARLGEAARSPMAPLTVRMLALGTLSLCEAELGNTAVSARLADQAMDLVTSHAMEQMPQVVFAVTAHGASLAASGEFAEARNVLEQGLRARRRARGLSPWPLIHHLVVTAAVTAKTGDTGRAEELLAEIDELAPWTDESMRCTRGRIADIRQRLLRPVIRPRVGEVLTPRELEILHRLHGSQTLREIAADLYVSHNTVKTLTLSLYRKLGAHTRSEVLAISAGLTRT